MLRTGKKTTKRLGTELWRSHFDCKQNKPINKRTAYDYNVYNIS